MEGPVDREECVYMAKLAEQAERYDEMARTPACLAPRLLCCRPLRAARGAPPRGTVLWPIGGGSRCAGARRRLALRRAAAWRGAAARAGARGG